VSVLVAIRIFFRMIPRLASAIEGDGTETYFVRADLFNTRGMTDSATGKQTREMVIHAHPEPFR